MKRALLIMPTLKPSVGAPKMVPFVSAFVLLTFTILSFLSLDARLVDTRADDGSDCIKAKGDTRIRGCSQIIQSRRLFGNPISRQNLAKAYNSRGLAFSRKGEFDRAIQDYDTAIMLIPKEAAAYTNRGLAYYSRGQHYRATQDFKTAIKLNPKDAAAYYNQGWAYTEKSYKDRAVAYLDKAIMLNPKLAVDYRETVESAVWELLDSNEIHTMLDIAIELDPKSAWAFTLRGQVYGEEGAYDKAIAAFSESIDLDPNSAVAFAQRGKVYRQKGEYGRAQADLSKTIEINPKDHFAWASRGEAYRQMGEYDKAIADFDEAIGRAPKYAIAYNRRGLAHEKKGNTAPALTDFRTAVELDPSSKEFRKAMERLSASSDMATTPDKTEIEFRQSVKDANDMVLETSSE